MSSVRVAITIDREILARVDSLVATSIFPNRSRAIQAAASEKIVRMERGRLASECAKLDPKNEKALAGEGLGQEFESWFQILRSLLRSSRVSMKSSESNPVSVRRSLEP